MVPLTLGEVASITGGRLIDGADPDAVVEGSVQFDSRKVVPGGLFLALPGSQVDGHDFAAQAFGAGAVASVVTRPVGVPAVLVEDGYVALGALAAAVARRLPDTFVVGITGSSGKTTTKDLIAQLLEKLGPTVAPPGSFNNELGHPYTVLTARPDTRFLVLETSARGIGHIRALTEIAPPRVGVVLNVGTAHIGEFGSQEAIAQAKGELVEALPPMADGGVAVLNADDPLVRAMSGRTAARVMTFGEVADAEMRAVDVVLDDLGRPSFDLVCGAERERVTLRLVGEHYVADALAAAAVAQIAGMPLPEIAAGLSAATARSKWRMEVTERPNGVVIVNDAYNASPESTRAALKALAAMGRAVPGRRTFAILGQMAELGEASPAEHDAIGRLAVRLDISQLIAVGEPARLIAQGAALEGSWNGESRWVPDIDKALEMLRGELVTGDVVLVKASRVAGLERLALALAAGDAPATAESVVEMRDVRR